MGLENTKAFFTPDELLETLPIGRTVLYRELRSGALPSRRLGKKYIIPRAAFERWLSEAGQEVQHA